MLHYARQMMVSGAAKFQMAVGVYTMYSSLAVSMAIPELSSGLSPLTY